MLEVVAAWIVQEDKFLICQRPHTKARGGLWEFPGGKIEPGETPEQAVVRECQEELAVTLSVLEPAADLIYNYPDLTIHLTLFRATLRNGIPTALEHAALQWITVDEISAFPFCEADSRLIAQLLPCRPMSNFVK